MRRGAGVQLLMVGRGQQRESWIRVWCRCGCASKGTVVPADDAPCCDTVGLITDSRCRPADRQRSQPEPLGTVVGNCHDVSTIQIRGAVRYLHQARRRRGVPRFAQRQPDWRQLHFVTPKPVANAARGGAKAKSATAAASTSRVITVKRSRSRSPARHLVRRYSRPAPLCPPDQDARAGSGLQRPSVPTMRGHVQPPMWIFSITQSQSSTGTESSRDELV